jgi:hypothetical protein
MNCFEKEKGKKEKVKREQTPRGRLGSVDFVSERPFAFYLFTFSF